MSGRRSSRRVSLSRAKAGDSKTRSRMKSPTAISTVLSRKGIRQPQARNCWSESWEEKRANTPVESRLPAGTPIWGQLPWNPRWAPPECSTAMSTAPPHSPPTPIPWAKRSRVSQTGAQTPTVA